MNLWWKDCNITFGLGPTLFRHSVPLIILLVKLIWKQILLVIKFQTNTEPLPTWYDTLYLTVANEKAYNHPNDRPVMPQASSGHNHFCNAAKGFSSHESCTVIKSKTIMIRIAVKEIRSHRSTDSQP